MSASNLAIAADSWPLRLKTSTTEDNIENRMVTEKDKMLSGEMYDATVPQLTAERQRRGIYAKALNESYDSEQKLRERIIRESSGAGLTVFTRIPIGAPSWAAARIMPTTACFVAEYMPSAALVTMLLQVRPLVATKAIDRGLDVLIEKPIAATVKDGQVIVDQAREKGVTCMVGHDHQGTVRIEMLPAVDGQGDEGESEQQAGKPPAQLLA